MDVTCSQATQDPSSHFVLSCVKRRKISTAYMLENGQKQFGNKGEHLFHQEIFLPGNPSSWNILIFLLLGNLFSPGNSYHWEIFVIGKSFPPGNPYHRKFLPTRKSSTGKSFTRGIPSHQEILLTGNSFLSGNPSNREFLNPPRNPSHREFILNRKSLPPGISS